MRDQIGTIFANMTEEQQKRWREYTQEVVNGQREMMSVEFMISVQSDEDIKVDPVDALDLDTYRVNEEQLTKDIKELTRLTALLGEQAREAFEKGGE